MGFDTSVGEKYSTLTGGIFVFNLIVGIGAITMPQGFEAAGIGFGTIVLLVIGFLSFVSTTWVVEVQATANAVLSLQDLSVDFQTKNSSYSSSSGDDRELDFLSDSVSNKRNRRRSEKTPLKYSNSINNSYTNEEFGDWGESNVAVANSSTNKFFTNDDSEDYSEFNGDDHSSTTKSYYFSEDGKPINSRAVHDRDYDWWYIPTGEEHRFNMERRVEMGVMSEIFLGFWGQKFFYLVLIIYLIGDLAIYAVTVPASLAQVTGGWGGISEDNVYYIYLAMFGGVAVPFCFFNFQKTKILQITTAILRNVALFLMIILALIYIGNGNGANPKKIDVFLIDGFGSLFGVAIYSFMCHHSLPSLITPIDKKHQVTKMLFFSMVGIFFVYNLMNYSAVFAFGDKTNSVCEVEKDWACSLQPLLTLNFFTYPVRVLGYFLALFPVFTLSTNYPLIAITLRNNLRQFFQIGIFREERKQDYPRLHKYQNHFWSALAAIPPFIIAFATKDVDTLVSVTGSYAGLFIMWVIPAILVIYSRRYLKKNHELLSKTWNKHQTPFEHISWQILLLIFAALALIYITADDIYKLAT